MSKGRSHLVCNLGQVIIRAADQALANRDEATTVMLINQLYAYYGDEASPVKTGKSPVSKRTWRDNRRICEALRQISELY